MAAAIEPVLRDQLVERRHKLETAIALTAAAPDLAQLLREVDAALARMERGAYGLCEVCHDPVEPERLIADPLVRFCIDHLTPSQQVALQQDLDLAARIQGGLLPANNLRADGWHVSYHYEAAGAVSGDYCDMVRAADGTLYFMLGDVSGKGIAASMLMSHLHAMFHSLIPLGLPLAQLVERASRIFCESTLPTHFATLVCGTADPTGAVEICNAGHLPPLWIQRGEASSIAATGLPVGVFCNERFTADTLRLAPGDTLLLYTDGLSETQDSTGAEYGTPRLSELICKHHALAPDALVNICLADLSAFRAAAPMTDDLTIMTIRRID